MDVTRAWRKYGLVLLVLAAAGTLAVDYWSSRPLPFGEKTPGGPERAGEGHRHAPDDPHTDPEKNRRMGIYHFNEGNRFLKQGDWDEAIRNYKMALAHESNFPQVYVNLSTTYLKAERFEDARRTLDQLQKIDPDSPHLHYNRACYYSLTGQPRKSLEALQGAVDSGYQDWTQIQTDPDLARLRQTREYRQWRKARSGEDPPGSKKT